MVDDFKDAPLSISEIRSERSGDPHDWTPRDTLIALLREIDAGSITLKSVVIVTLIQIDKDTTKTGFLNSSASLPEALGMLDRAAWVMNNGAEHG